ncbi:MULTISPECIES: hypothetical protein [unclassified Bosea (in: a-proteobacteria)]|uniref:hypothetical protein n=1 Tax=unclassified Bosea (in: a-proteobacteria) TaxID=2653178 RepID=UPI000F74EF92|nr:MULTISPECIES: hypothetical protein [unclassified Bosea (in: a-proteobacteria)]AZO80632.1 hypothetical protein BLM15_25995 [Bosea sp. Tri-49]RXT25592.1 hypothetical protein B5U98_03150 [Bosea sp. Tri-39]RXT30833.1 hypothetical protein B5U99_18695 [Bosea sp. Tri-54]
MMIRTAVLSLAIALVAGSNVSAAPAFMPLPGAASALPIEPARSALRNFFDALGDDDVHDDHYDWNDYRDATSRKDRIRDYQRMQIDAQKDYWRQQKDMQKQAIKAQRGW